MKKLVILLLLISLNSFSQTLVWEKLIDYFPSSQEEIYSIDQDSDSTFIFCSSNTQNTAIARAKLNGDTLWKKNTNIISGLNYERVAPYHNNTFMHFGNKWTGSQRNFLFQKLDSNGNIISSWDYGDSGVNNTLENYALLPDGGFLAAGLRQSTYYDYLSLMKLDSSGNMLWYKKYRDISGTTDVIVNRKGNYLLSATSGDQIFSPVFHTYFLEVTPDGDSINSKYLIVHADSVNEMRTWIKWGMLQNEDDNYVFTITIDSVQQKGGTALERYAAVVMMDTLFNIKWKLYLNKGAGGAFYPSRVIELKDSSYVLVVFNTMPESNQFYYYKISKTGQVLDQKVFSSSLCNKIYTTEIKLLSDSSLIISGYCNDAQNAYLARVDSVGLPMVITSTTEPKEESSLQVIVYPNPFNTSATFKITDKPGRNYTLTLYNTFGQQMGSYKITGNEYTVEKNILPAGLYFYKLASDKGEVRTGKVVAE
jgi:hypothetical protein